MAISRGQSITLAKEVQFDEIIINLICLLHLQPSLHQLLYGPICGK